MTVIDQVQPNRRVAWARRLILLAACLGFFASSYLLIKYVTRGTITCGLVHGCDIVRSSPYAYPLGIPLPLFGVLFYGAILVGMLLRAFAPSVHPRRMHQLLFAASIFGFADSVFLTGVQAWSIGVYCLWCLVSAASATTIFLGMLVDNAHVGGEDEVLHEMKWAFGLLAFAVMMGGAGMFALLSIR